MKSWKPATAGKFEYGARERDLEGHGLVVRDDTGDGVVAGRVERLLATFDEGEEVAVVTGEGRGPLPGRLEGARNDLLAAQRTPGRHGS